LRLQPEIGHEFQELLDFAVLPAVPLALVDHPLGLVLWLPGNTGQGDEIVGLERFLRELGESLATQTVRCSSPRTR
jgi:hypothetical protein